MGYYIKKHWKINCLVIFLFALSNGLIVLNNLIMIKIFAQIIDRNLRAFFIFFGLSALTWGSYIAIDTLADILKYKAIKKMNNTYRNNIILAISQKKFCDYHKMESGEYLSWITNDVNQIENLAWNPFFELAARVSSIIVSIGALFSLHWSLTVLSLCVAAIMFFVPKLFQNQMQALGKTCSEEQAYATSKIKNIISGMDVFRAFGKKERLKIILREVFDNLEGPRYVLNSRKVIFSNGISVVNILCQLLVNLYIGYLSISGIIIQSALMGGGNLCGNIYSGLSAMSKIKLSIASAEPYFSKVIYEKKNEKTISKEFPALKNSIVVHDLGFSYDENKCVIHDLDLAFEKGKKYALIGKSGSGKSTILHILLGRLDTYQGEILYDNVELRKFSEDEIQQQVGYIEQDVFLFNESIKYNITLGDAFSDQEIENAIEDSALLKDIINMPEGLETIVGEDGNNISGGQKQRIAIARALIHKKSILIIDEGTSALDKENANYIEEKLLNNDNLTLILVSHHLDDIRKQQFDGIYNLNQLMEA